MDKLGEPKQHVPVFVGSTYEDLKEHRQFVKEALHRLEKIVRGMEYFGSKPGTPKEECLKAVRSCEVYIGIFAMRYGSIDEETGKSMTELEYDEAQRLKIPSLIYLIDEELQPVLPKFVDTDEKAEKLKTLKEKLKNKFMVSFFTSPDDLSKKVTQDLPVVLREKGIDVEKESIDIHSEQAEQIISKFKVRPKKYSGQEITINCKIHGDHVRAVDEEDCEALGLTIGDTIKLNVKSSELGHTNDSWSYDYICASGKIADRLEELNKEDDIQVKIKLLFGKKVEIQWSEDGPISKPEIIKAFRVIDFSS